MSKAENDKKLVDRVLNGDKKAFEELVFQYEPKIRFLVQRYIDDTSEISDVCQEIYLRAFQGLPKFRNECSFYTWLFRITINTSLNYIQTKGMRIEKMSVEFNEKDLLISNNRINTFEGPEEILIRDELEASLYDAVDDLSDELSLCLMLREIAGLSYDDIAVLMDCPVGTIKSRLSRARHLVDEEISSDSRPPKLSK